MQCLNLASNLGSEVESEATHKKYGSKAYDAICQTLEFSQVLVDSAALNQFEQHPLWIIIVRGRKIGFQTL